MPYPTGAHGHTSKPGKAGNPKPRWALFHGHGWVKVGSPRWTRLTTAKYRTVAGARGTYRTKVRDGLTPKQFTRSVGNPSNYGKGAEPKIPVRGVPHKQPGETKAQTHNRQAANAGVSRNARRNGAGGGGGGGGNSKAKGKAVRQNYGLTGRQIGSPNVGQMLKTSMANDLAGMQFDPQIQQVKDLIQQLPQQDAQNLHDIGQWYGQVGQLNDAAGQQAQQQGQQLGQAQGDMTQSVLAALGGGANAAGGVMGAQGADQAAMLRILGSINSQSHANQAPFLALQQAGAQQAQMALDQQSQHDARLQLTGLQGQRGQAQTKALLDILNANNSLAQTRFGNRLSKLQAQSGIAQLMGSLALQHQQIRGQQIANRQAGGGPKNSGGQTPWAKLDPADRYALMSRAAGLDANGHPTVSHGKAMAMLKAMGYGGVGLSHTMRNTFNWG